MFYTINNSIANNERFCQEIYTYTYTRIYFILWRNDDDEIGGDGG